MGVVYAARHLKLDRPVAIKMMHATFAANDAAVRRFFDEARAAGSLRHPNVIDVLDVDADDGGTPFMVMEMLEGEPLSALLARRGAMPADEVLALLDPVLDGLAAAHARGIVHRDLKPDNLFLAREGAAVVPKILDFGIAKLRDPQTPGTATGAIVGTPMYMAPEQAAGTKEVGPWVDVWAIGAVLFEAISGRSHLELPPDAGVMAILSALATQAPRRLAELAPSCPPTVARAIDAALVPDATHRLRSITSLRAMLRGEPLAPTRAPSSSTPASATVAPVMPATRLGAPQPPRARLALAAAVTLGVSSLLAFGAFGAWALGAWVVPRPAQIPIGTNEPAASLTAGDTPSVLAPTRREPGPNELDPEETGPETNGEAVDDASSVEDTDEQTADENGANDDETGPPAGGRARPRRPVSGTADAPSMRASSTRTGTWNPDDL